jgi:predicted DNA-binding transcriptional regulator AlpA
MTTATFKTEVQRRLIDTWELMLLLGLRSKTSVWQRVDRGELPEPVIRKDTIAFWDRDELEPFLEETG